MTKSGILLRANDKHFYIGCLKTQNTNYIFRAGRKTVRAGQGAAPSEIGLAGTLATLCRCDNPRFAKRSVFCNITSSNEQRNVLKT